MEQVIDLAHLLGWKCAHFRSVRVQRRDGSVFYQTPVQADGTGFVDLVLVHPDKRRTLFCELKSDKGKPSPEQQEWLNWLAADNENEVYLWAPADWPEIEEVLLRKPTRLEAPEHFERDGNGTA